MEIKFTPQDTKKILELGNGGFSYPTLRSFLNNPKNFSGHENSRVKILEAIKQYDECAWKIISDEG